MATEFEVNIHAMFYLAKAATPHMPPGSAIINTASINADTKRIAAAPPAGRPRDDQLEVDHTTPAQKPRREEAVDG